MRFDDLTKMKKMIEVKGMEFPVFVTNYGAFVTMLDEASDHWLEALSLAELRRRIEKVIEESCTPIAIPFCLVSNRRRLVFGVVRGIHAGNGGFLVTWNDTTKEAVGKHYAFWEVVTAEKAVEINAIVDELNKQQRLYDEAVKDLPKIAGSVMADRVKAALSIPKKD